jgi:hypothetical protein
MTNVFRYRPLLVADRAFVAVPSDDAPLLTPCALPATRVRGLAGTMYPATSSRINPPQRICKEVVLACDMVQQRIVNERLAVATAALMYPCAEPVEQIVVEPDRNPGLALLRWNDRSAHCARKIVLAFHLSFPS